VLFDTVIHYCETARNVSFVIAKNQKTAAKNRQERAFKKHLGEKLHCKY